LGFILRNSARLQGAEIALLIFIPVVAIPVLGCNARRRTIPLMKTIIMNRLVRLLIESPENPQ
jgi:hypothetical protein